MVANAAAVAATGLPEDLLCGTAMENLFGQPELVRAMIAKGYHLPMSEVVVDGESFLVETFPLSEASGSVAGAVLTLHAPHRIGERLSALQNYDAGGFENILGSSPALQVVKQRAARMAQVDARC